MISVLFQVIGVTGASWLLDYLQHGREQVFGPHLGWLFGASILQGILVGLLVRSVPRARIALLGWGLMTPPIIVGLVGFFG